MRRTVKRHTMFQRGDTVVVGCSGGADSVCLLHILMTGLHDLGLACIAVYVDHQLRNDIDHEIEVVKRLAQSVGATFVPAVVDVPARISLTGESTQDAARTLRYAILEKIRHENGGKTVAVGHTKSDQAETVLLQILRGAGPKGLAGIRPVYDRIVRPLIELSRAEVEAYCQEHGLDFVTDPSNDEDVYLRNRVRRHVLPLLEEISPGVEDHLARVADILGEEERWLEDEVNRAVCHLVTKEEGEGGPIYTIGTSHFQSLPLGLVRRLVRRIVALVRGDEKGLDFTHVETIINAARMPHLSGRPGTIQIGTFGGVRVVKEYEHLLFLSTDTNLNPPPFLTHTVKVPGDTFVKELNLTICSRIVRAEDKKSEQKRDIRRVVRFDYDLIEFPVEIRSRKPGDFLHLAGERRKKVKDVFIDARVPRRLRDTIPLIADRQGVLWVVGHGVSGRACPRSDTTTILEVGIRYHSEDNNEK